MILDSCNQLYNIVYSNIQIQFTSNPVNLLTVTGYIVYLQLHRNELIQADSVNLFYLLTDSKLVAIQIGITQGAGILKQNLGMLYFRNKSKDPS